MLNQRKCWTQSEDTILSQLYQENKIKIKNQELNWNFVANKLNQVEIGSIRSGKQCRQRWFNHLNPQINRNIEWTKQNKNLLIQLHTRFGSKWAMIAKHFQGRTDNSIKNYMNSTLRKGLRLLNLYISKNRKFKQFKFRNVKEYKADLLNKILIFSGVQDSKKEFQQNFLFSTTSQNKSQILAKVYQISRELKQQLLNLQEIYQNQNINLTQMTFYHPIEFLEDLIIKIHHLNLICRRRKQKKVKESQLKSNKQCNVKPSQRQTQIKFHSGGIQQNEQKYSSQKIMWEPKFLYIIESKAQNSNKQNAIKINSQDISEGYKMKGDFPEKRKQKLSSLNNVCLNKVETYTQRQCEKDKTVNLKNDKIAAVGISLTNVKEFRQFQSSIQEENTLLKQSLFQLKFSQKYTTQSEAKRQDNNLNEQNIIFQEENLENQSNPDFVVEEMLQNSQNLNIQQVSEKYYIECQNLSDQVGDFNSVSWEVYNSEEQVI